MTTRQAKVDGDQGAGVQYGEGVAFMEEDARKFLGLLRQWERLRAEGESADNQSIEMVEQRILGMPSSSVVGIVAKLRVALVDSMDFDTHDYRGAASALVTAELLAGLPASTLPGLDMMRHGQPVADEIDDAAEAAEDVGDLTEGDFPPKRGGPRGSADAEVVGAACARSPFTNKLTFAGDDGGLEFPVFEAGDAWKIAAASHVIGGMAAMELIDQMREDGHFEAFHAVLSRMIAAARAGDFEAGFIAALGSFLTNGAVSLGSGWSAYHDAGG
jgi:hypothetical protein